MKKMDSSKVAFIVIHCSATLPSRDYSKEDMLQDHLKRGFSSWGYHFYVRRTGECLSLRPINLCGAHTKGYNHCSIGICYEGGVDRYHQAKDTRTIAQKEALQILIEKLRSLYPKARVLGHRDLSPDLDRNGIISSHEWIKLCPSFDAEKEYN